MSGFLPGVGGPLSYPKIISLLFFPTPIEVPGLEEAESVLSPPGTHTHASGGFSFFFFLFLFFFVVL